MSVRLASSAVALALLTACSSAGSLHEVAIETPLQPKLDVSSFSHILIAGFIVGGSDEVDANRETARLLRSQLRNRSDLRVVEADVLSLTEMALLKEVGEGFNDAVPLAEPNTIAEEQELEEYERVFADLGFWQELGASHQQPLIVTGTVLFTPHARAGFVTQEQESYDSFGRRRVVPIRAYRERTGYVLSPKFVFIDGRTGATLYTESHREEILYEAEQNTPALSSYFELMDRLLPTFLSALSTQTIRGTRILLR